MHRIDAVTERLRLAGCVAAEHEAHDLLADAPDDEDIEGRLERREAGEPLAWILGWTDFCGERHRISAGVYVPRPQTEALARRAAAALPETGRALDLCTGAGAIAAHLHRSHPAASVIAVDIDPRAAADARANGVPALVCDLASAVRPGGDFDVITAVAPYVPTDELAFLPSDVRRHEPAPALDGGPHGTAVIVRIIVAASLLLGPDGHLLLEVGGTQDAALAPMLEDRFATVEWWHDEDDDLRGVDASGPHRPTSGHSQEQPGRTLLGADEGLRS